MFQLTQQYSILYDLIEVFGDVYNLITVITSSQEEGSPRMDPILFIDSTNSILHRLTISAAPTGCDDDFIHLYECCRLGTLLFTRGISEQSVWPPPTRQALFNHVKESLRSHIEDDCSWINLKLWTLFMAGVTATGLPQRTWFIAQAASITLKLDKKNWEDIRVFLTQFWSVIFLDWSGVDLSPNPLHPASKLFDSRSSMELRCIYILNIERLGVSVVLQKEG